MQGGWAAAVATYASPHLLCPGPAAQRQQSHLNTSSHTQKQPTAPVTVDTHQGAHNASSYSGNTNISLDWGRPDALGTFRSRDYLVHEYTACFTQASNDRANA